MHNLIRYFLFCFPLAGFGFMFAWINHDMIEHDVLAKEEVGEFLLEPVETEWLYIMSLVYEPAFDRLKNEIGSKSDGGEADLVAVKKNALILAEFTSRLHQWPDFQSFDSAEEESAYLEKHKLLKTAEVQRFAAEIYNAAKDKQLEVAKEKFVSMTQACNACHRQKQTRWAPVILEH